MEMFLCGDAEASQAFYARNKVIIEAVTRGHDLCFELLANSQKKLDGQDRTVIWLLAASCLKEFEEIVLLCGNGFGTGAVKLMRSFYERVVTVSYLAVNTTEIQRFIDYSDIHWHKLLVEAEGIHSTFRLSPEARKHVEDNYADRKENFKQEDCKKCGTKRLQMSWTKLDMKTMASAVNEQLRLLLANAYLAPTFHLHTTFWGIVHQSDVGPEGKLRFLGGKVQEESAQESFEQAYILLTQLMDVLNQFFDLNQQEGIANCGQAWVRACESAWGKPVPSEVPPGD
jgi:hypothetical protein